MLGVYRTLRTLKSLKIDRATLKTSRGKSLPKMAYEISDFCNFQKNAVISVIPVISADFQGFLVI